MARSFEECIAKVIKYSAKQQYYVQVIIQSDSNANIMYKRHQGESRPEGVPAGEIGFSTPSVTPTSNETLPKDSCNVFKAFEDDSSRSSSECVDSDVLDGEEWPFDEEDEVLVEPPRRNPNGSGSNS